MAFTPQALVELNFAQVALDTAQETPRRPCGPLPYPCLEPYTPVNGV
jgi:hypothetical protein